MGKVKRRRGNNRSTPLGTNAENNDDAKYLTKINTLIKNLENVVPNERAMALNTITLLCEEERWRTLFLKQKLVPLLLQKLLNDTNDEIVVDSMGLLRNLCIEEGYDVCVYLWRNDFWVTITTAIAKINKSLLALQKENSIDPSKKAGKEGKRLLHDYADNLISNITALANGSETILKDLLDNKMEVLLEFIVDCLQYISSLPEAAVLPINLYNSILDMIYDFSSESAEFIDILSTHEYLSSFIGNLFAADGVKNTRLLGNELTQILIQGIRLQLSDMELSYDDANTITQECITIITSVDLEEIKQNLNNEEEENIINGTTKDENVGKKLKEITKRKEVAMIKVQAIEIGVDIITAVLEIIGSNLDQDKGKHNTQIEVLDPTFQVLPQFLHEIFITLELVQTRVLICWNNFLWVLLSISDNGIFSMSADASWKLLYQDMQISTINEKDESFQISKYGCLWALLKSNCEAFLQNQEIQGLELAQNLINVYTSSASEELHQRLIGCLTPLGKQSIELNLLVSEFFIEKLLTSDELSARCLCDLTNSVFEIYGDKSYSYDKPVFQDRQYLTKLSTVILPRLRDTFKFVDRNKDAGLKEMCTETFNTLEKFIQYKQDE